MTSWMLKKKDLPKPLDQFVGDAVVQLPVRDAMVQGVLS